MRRSSQDTRVEVRRHERSDIPRLREIITAVHAKTGYPVDGPACFEAFLDPPPGQLLHAITAVLLSTDSGAEGGGHRIAGQAMIMSPSPDVPNLASKVHLERGGTMENHAVLSHFFVDPSVQARGIGSKILEEATAWGRREGRRLVLIVLEKDKGAIRLYDRAGWVRVGECVFTSNRGGRYNTMAYLGPQ
ncbi:hypothetical protein diail_3292 [Diaporthe ilicicola]|nr:hypothetical protein diail_3292 [Diaporthe ilicicola]